MIRTNKLHSNNINGEMEKSMSMNMNASKRGEHENRTSRFIELDIIRGCAIVSMIFLHFLWDLDYFGLVTLDENIYQFNKMISTVFFLMVGICLAITINKRQISSKQTAARHLLFRGLWIFGIGMIITVITLIFMPDRPILFGVLHCIGFSIILSVPFLKFKSYNIVFAAVIILAGFIVGLYPVENPTIIHLAIGFHQSDISRYTIDYFPLLPWFGISLLGVALGNWLYKDGKRQFLIPDIFEYKPVSIVSWLGKHSLLIYLLHQPVIAGVLGLFVIL